MKAQLKTQKYHLKRHCASAHQLFGLGRSGAESTIWKAGKVSCQELVVLERIRGTKKAAKTLQTTGQNDAKAQRATWKQLPNSSWEDEPRDYILTCLWNEDFLEGHLSEGAHKQRKLWMLSYLSPFEDEGISTGGSGNQVHPGTSKSILVHQCACRQNFSFICKHLITNKLVNSTNCIQEVFVFGNHLCKYLFKLSVYFLVTLKSSSSC